MEEVISVDVFPGFWHPKERQGYTQLPHELIEEMSSMDDSELRVVLYIFRHTWGFQEFGEAKKLTTDEFMYGRKRHDGSRMDKGTGLSDRGVKNGIAKALAHGYIFCEVDDSDKGRIKKYYGIRVYEKEED
jgi:hypothetical protein